jgi:hypothetical protein
MIKLTATFDDSVLSSNKLSIDNLAHIEYLVSLLLNPRDVQNNISLKIMDELVKNTTHSRQAIEMYRFDFKLLGEIIQSLQIKVEQV